MEILIDGGFESLFEKDVTFELCQMLLWFGLRSEDPALTMEDTKKLMIGAGVGKDKTALVKSFTVCVQEMHNSGWYYTPSGDNQDDAPQDEREDTKSLSVKDHILDLVTMAEVSGLMDSEQIWKHTSSEIEALFKSVDMFRKAGRTLEDYRMGTICTTIMEALGREKSGGGRFTWHDFVPHETKPQTAKEMKDIILAANTMFGGK